MESKPSQPVKKMPPMELPADLEPVYVNLVRITHSPSEMIFDFARMLPGNTDVPVQTRILMSPLMNFTQVSRRSPLTTDLSALADSA